MATYTQIRSGRWMDSGTWTTSKVSGIDGMDSWTPLACTITPNSIGEPFNSLRIVADKITEDSTNAVHRIRSGGMGPTDNATTTYIFFVKSDGRTWCIGTGLNKANSIYRVWFNLSGNGSIGTIDNGVTNTSIIYEGNDWYRCQLSFPNSVGATTQVVYIGTSTGDGIESFIGDITKGIYVWGATTYEGTPLYPNTTGDVTNIVSPYTCLYDWPSYTQHVTEISGNIWYHSWENLWLPEVGSWTLTGTTKPSISVVANKVPTRAMTFLNQALYTNTTMNLSSIDKLSIEFWYRPTTYDTAADDYIFESSAIATSNNGAFSIRTAGSQTGDPLIILFQTASSNQSAWYNLTTTGFTNSTWYHVLITMDRTINPGIQLYINGVLKTADSRPSVDTGGNFGDYILNIGSRNNSSNFLNGTLGPISMYNRILSVTEALNNYNIQTVEWATCTVNSGSILKASRTKSIQYLGTRTTNLTNNGTIDFGTLTEPISASYKSYLLKDNTGGTDGSTTTTLCSNAVNSTIKFCGDPNYYGSIWKTYFYTDISGGGYQITVPIDISTKWKNGQEIYIHKGDTFSSQATDAARHVIDGTPTWDGSKSTITIYPALGSGTWKQGGLVVNSSRNLILAKNQFLTGHFLANSLRPTGISGNVTNPHEIDSIELIGFSPAITNIVGITSNNCVYKNVVSLLTSCPDSITNNLTVGHSFSFSSCYFSNIYDTIIGATTTNLINNCPDFNFYGTIVNSFSSTLVSTNQTKINYKNGCRIYSCGSPFMYFCNADIEEGVKIGYNEANLTAPNTFDAYLNAGYIRSKGLFSSKPTYTKLFSSQSLTTGAHRRYLTGKAMYQGWDGNSNTHLTQYGCGELSQESIILRPHGSGETVKIEPNNFVGTFFDYLDCLDSWIESNVPATQQTRSIFIKGYGWNIGNFPSNTELYLEATYLTGSGMNTFNVTSTTILIDNEWTEFPITFTPGIIGNVSYKLYVKKYIINCGFYLDHALYRGTLKSIPGVWIDGDTRLSGGYNYEKHNKYSLRGNRKIYG